MYSCTCHIHVHVHPSKAGTKELMLLIELAYLFFNSISDMVCFGVGAGANVLTELAVSIKFEENLSLIINDFSWMANFGEATFSYVRKILDNWGFHCVLTILDFAKK